MRCQWKTCNGLIGEEGRCIICGHSLNIAREQEIELQKALVKTDWQTCSTDSYKEGKLKKKYA